MDRFAQGREMIPPRGWRTPKREEMKSVGILMGPFILIALFCFGSEPLKRKTEKSESVFPVSVRALCMPISPASAVVSGKKAWMSTYLAARGQICTMALISGQMELTTNPERVRCHGRRQISRQGDLCHG